MPEGRSIDLQSGRPKLTLGSTVDFPALEASGAQSAAGGEPLNELMKPKETSNHPSLYDVRGYTHGWICIIEEHSMLFVHFLDSVHFNYWSLMIRGSLHLQPQIENEFLLSNWELMSPKILSSIFKNSKIPKIIFQNDSTNIFCPFSPFCLGRLSLGTLRGAFGAFSHTGGRPGFGPRKSQFRSGKVEARRMRSEVVRLWG